MNSSRWGRYSTEPWICRKPLTNYGLGYGDLTGRFCDEVDGLQAGVSYLDTLDTPANPCIPRSKARKSLASKSRSKARESFASKFVADFEADFDSESRATEAQNQV